MAEVFNHSEVRDRMRQVLDEENETMTFGQKRKDVTELGNIVEGHQSNIIPATNLTYITITQPEN